MSAAQSLTEALGGTWLGDYGVARCPAHEDRNPSLSLADGTTGRILLKCHAGCRYEEIREALVGRGLDGNAVYGRSNFDPEQAGRKRAMEAAESRKRSDQARRLWDVAKPICDSAAETYLRNRGVRCALPDTLRYVSECWHPTAKRLPALVCNVTGGNGFAVHRTYLSPDGSGKAHVQPSKAMLGGTKGGAVRLACGGDRLVIAEGVETALSLLSGLLPDRPSVWAALSASGMVSLRLPKRPGRLTIAADGDATGREAANRLARRATCAGWQVSMLIAPEGKDWNDVLREREVIA